MSEALLQQQIRLTLGQRDDIMLFRINVGKFRPMEGGPRVIQSAPEGTPDLLGVMTPGRAIAIEVKAPKGRQRDAQVAFQKAWEARGGIYVLAKSIDDVYRGLGISPEK